MEVAKDNMLVTDWKAYAPYFSQEEFDCTHTGKCDMLKSTMDRLLLVRKEFNAPMNISSGYRDPSHPIEAAKDEPGAHTLGCSVDVLVAGGDAIRLVQIALKHGFTGIGVQQKGAKRFIHLDDYEGSSSMPRPWLWSY